MVRYDRDHKRRTRASIVGAASQAFRAHGIEQVGVGDVMARAGLTHGGFYAHFESKDELVAEACASSLLEAAGRSFGSQDETTPKPTLSGFIRSYLSRSHRDTPETGCAIAALAGDIARRSLETRHTFTQAVQAYLDGVATLLPEGADRDDAWALLAGMAGTLMLARTVDDPVISDRILLSGRHFYQRAFGAEVGTVSAEGNQ